MNIFNKLFKKRRTNTLPELPLRERRLSRAAFVWIHTKDPKFPSWFEGFNHKNTVEFGREVAFATVGIQKSEQAAKVERFVNETSENSLMTLALGAAGCMEREGGDYDEQVEVAALTIIGVAMRNSSE